MLLNILEMTNKVVICCNCAVYCISMYYWLASTFYAVVLAQLTHKIVYAKFYCYILLELFIECT